MTGADGAATVVAETVTSSPELEPRPGLTTLPLPLPLPELDLLSKPGARPPVGVLPGGMVTVSTVVVDEPGMAAPFELVQGTTVV